MVATPTNKGVKMATQKEMQNFASKIRRVRDHLENAFTWNLSLQKDLEKYFDGIKRSESDELTMNLFRTSVDVDHTITSINRDLKDREDILSMRVNYCYGKDGESRGRKTRS